MTFYSDRICSPYLLLLHVSPSLCCSLNGTYMQLHAAASLVALRQVERGSKS